MSQLEHLPKRSLNRPHCEISPIPNRSFKTSGIRTQTLWKDDLIRLCTSAGTSLEADKLSYVLTRPCM